MVKEQGLFERGLKKSPRLLFIICLEQRKNI